MTRNIKMTGIVLLVLLTGLYANQIYWNSETFHRCDTDQHNWVPLLTRWTLFKSKAMSVLFHKFKTSDGEDLHDHPWDFISIIIWRGYNEETYVYPVEGLHVTDYKIQSKRITPGSIIYRPAEHIHRVVLIDHKPAYSLVISFKNRRAWGFWVKGLWVYWKNYDNKRRC